MTGVFQERRSFGWKIKIENRPLITSRRTSWKSLSWSDFISLFAVKRQIFHWTSTWRMTDGIFDVVCHVVGQQCSLYAVILIFSPPEVHGPCSRGPATFISSNFRWRTRRLTWKHWKSSRRKWLTELVDRRSTAPNAWVLRIRWNNPELIVTSACFLLWAHHKNYLRHARAPHFIGRKSFRRVISTRENSSVIFEYEGCLWLGADIFHWNIGSLDFESWEMFWGVDVLSVHARRNVFVRVGAEQDLRRGRLHQRRQADWEELPHNLRRSPLHLFWSSYYCRANFVECCSRSIIVHVLRLQEWLEQ